jgi:hypothetical protein
MSRTALLIISLLLLLSNCKRGGLTVYAPAELADARIFIDGKAAGQFETTQRTYRWLGWSKMKKELGAPPRSETIAILPPIAPGRHELRVEKLGYEPVAMTFNYTGKHTEVDIGDALAKRVSRNAPR